jgi:hypothetical protein
MAEIDWPRLAVEAVSAAASGFAGLLVGVWRWGRSSALFEQQLLECFAKVEEMRAALKKVETENDERLDLLVEQFREAFSGIRRQVDDNRLSTEKDFLRKDDFKDFREEYRADIRELKRCISDVKG